MNNLPTVQTAQWDRTRRHIETAPFCCPATSFKRGIQLNNIQPFLPVLLVLCALIALVLERVLIVIFAKLPLAQNALSFPPSLFTRNKPGIFKLTSYAPYGSAIDTPGGAPNDPQARRFKLGSLQLMPETASKASDNK